MPARSGSYDSRLSPLVESADSRGAEAAPERRALLREETSPSEPDCQSTPAPPLDRSTSPAPAPVSFHGPTTALRATAVPQQSLQISPPPDVLEWDSTPHAGE